MSSKKCKLARKRLGKIIKELGVRAWEDKPNFKALSQELFVSEGWARREYNDILARIEYMVRKNMYEHELANPLIL